VARHLDFVDYAAEVPVHTHRKGQLIIARYGAVSCYAENDIWIVPPDCAVWIPGGIPHSAKATWNAHLNYLFIEPGAAAAGEMLHAGDLALIKELVDRLTREGVDYPPTATLPADPGHARRARQHAAAEAKPAGLNRSENSRHGGPLVSRPEDRSTLKTGRNGSPSASARLPA
jgi:hypothetical protein